MRVTWQAMHSMDSPEDLEAVPTQDTRSKQWHPKLTAYRLLVLTTTIGLGTFKAIATFRGLSFVSTTIEWIGGVVLFSVLSLWPKNLSAYCILIKFSIFILSLFEHSPPSRLSCTMLCKSYGVPTALSHWHLQNTARMRGISYYWRRTPQLRAIVFYAAYLLAYSGSWKHFSHMEARLRLL